MGIKAPDPPSPYPPKGPYEGFEIPEQARPETACAGCCKTRVSSHGLGFRVLGFRV